jgi:hypothetical protein
MSVVTCPNCNNKVFPRADGTCPSCQFNLSQTEKSADAMAPAPGTEPGIQTQKAQDRKFSLIILTFILVGFIAIRVFYFTSAEQQAENIYDQYLSEWSEAQTGQLEDDMMDQRINAIDPRPFGYNSDGLFNEPFDDMVAFYDQGVTSIDAHDSIPKLTEHLTAARYGMRTFQSLQRDAENPSVRALTGLTEDDVAYYAQQTVEARSLIINTAATLVMYRYKAHAAQVLGLYDTLIGLALISILVTIVIYALGRRKARRNDTGSKINPG